MKKIILSLMIFLSVFGVTVLFRNVYVSRAEVRAKSCILMDYDSKTVVYKQNEKERRPIASMCKIMTLLLIFEEIDNGNISLDETMTISETAAGMGGSQAFLEAGGEYPVKELIKSIVIASANDSCVAFAERISASEDQFVEKMNSRAKELGMNDTLFSNCTGLPKPTQYSTAEDAAKMFSELIKHKTYFEFTKIWTDAINHPKGRITELTNTNKMVRFYNGCDGGKTGYTAEAGHCLSVTAKRGNMRLVAVVIGAPDSKTRFAAASELLNKGFNEYENKTILNSTEAMDFTVYVHGGVKKNVLVKPEKDCYFFCKKGTQTDFRVDAEQDFGVKAPLKEGDRVGVLKVYKDNAEYDEVSLVAAENIDEISYFGYIRDVMRNWSFCS
mgnify:FL=1